MRLLTRSFCVAFTALVVAAHATGQSPGGSKAVQGSGGRVSVRTQPGAPLRVSSVKDNSDDADAPVVEFVVENLGGKPIQAFWIAYDTVARGFKVTLGLGVNDATSEQVLPPGRRRELGILNREKQPVALSVDFVEFADGTTWGADAARYAESLEAERAGGRAESQRLLKLLGTGGPAAVMDAVAGGTISGQANPQSRSEWNFLIGVRIVRTRIQRAFAERGLAGVEDALRQPYDMSALARQP